MTARRFNMCLPWFTWPLGEYMEQINCFVFYDLGSLLQEILVRSRKGAIQAWVSSAVRAAQILHGMLSGGSRFRFDESQGAAIALLRELQDWIAIADDDPNRNLDSSDPEIEDLHQAIGTFGNALSLEMGRAPIFLVLPKGIYDTRALIANASAMYEGYADRLPPEAILDTDQAGRCLAFHLPTAAGFHIARAAESVIKAYMAAYGCEPIKESQRNWGNYTRALREKGANPIIVHHIDQIRELHRNPLTHPDVTLSTTDAMSLQAMCQSVIQSMIADMESKKSDPDPEIVKMLPKADGQ